ncbi:MAG TPA: hypothetical protein VF839_10140 [Clostridium sp.]
MSKRKSKSGAKKGKSKKIRVKDNKSNLSEKQENLQKSAYEYFSEIIPESEAEKNEINSGESTSKASDINSGESISETSDTNTAESTSETSSDNANDCYKEIKAKQQELLNKLNDLSLAIASMALIRDNVNSLRVDTLTELYFTRQVRPLLDALNIIAFSVNNMTTGAVNIQANAFGDRKEIRHVLNLSYRMNDEVDDIIDALGRRLKIFVKQIDNIDKNCPPFD